MYCVRSMTICINRIQTCGRESIWEVKVDGDDGVVLGS